MSKFLATVQKLNRVVIPKEIIKLEKIIKGSIVEIEVKKVK
jgi:bifunctional DNA-binding transcriptional regulator/antitoxin component of YhaV-PrlF toxin-antitoxin module